MGTPKGKSFEYCKKVQAKAILSINEVTCLSTEHKKVIEMEKKVYRSFM